MDNMSIRPVVFYALVLGWAASILAIVDGILIYLDIDAIGRNPYYVPLEFAFCAICLVTSVIIFILGRYDYHKEAILFLIVAIAFLIFVSYVAIEYGPDDSTTSQLGQPSGPGAVGN
jgi:hypothetical protein